MKRPLWILVGVAALIVLIWAFFFRQSDASGEIEYRYAEIEKAELIRSTSANGQVVALTTVDVKSKAGGKVIKLYVEEGSKVQQGDLVAEIDPADTKATYDQANADLSASEAQVSQAQLQIEIQEKNARDSVKDAELSLELAKIRLEKARETAKAQPELTKASISNAKANLAAQQEALRVLEQVTNPQLRRDAQGSLDRTKAELDASEADLKRQEELLAKGYVSQAVVERARSSYQAARSAFRTAQQKMDTLESQIRGEVDSQKARVAQAKSSLDSAQVNSNQDFQSKKSLEEAERAVKQSEISLTRARTEELNVQVRRADLKSAEASVLRNRIRTENADVNYKDATVRAPRSGIVTLKYLEEGTIIPPGTSTFAQGTSLVQISDITTMYVECAVDEADISSVRKGQKTRIVAEAYPGLTFTGEVDRVSPAATTASNVTTVKVRVKVTGAERSARSGMQRRLGAPAGAGAAISTEAKAALGLGSSPDAAPGESPAPGAPQGAAMQGGAAEGRGQRTPGGGGQGQMPGGSASGSPGGPPGGRQGRGGQRNATTGGGDNPLLPGMNATVEFIVLDKPDVLVAPAQAIKRDGGESYVMLKTANPLKPVKRIVKLGETGNGGVEVLEGLKAGEEVVVAEIDLAEIREIQRRMQEAQQGGGLAGGSAPRGPTRTTGGGTAGGGGGNRAGGGGR